jgi:3-carboxy-cis,cis-muconate cycloisomerase
MRANLGLTRGLVLAEAVTTALADRIGRLEAHHLLEAASRRAVAEGRPLGEVLEGDPAVTAHLSPETLRDLLVPERYLGAAAAMVRRALDTRTPST